MCKAVAVGVAVAEEQELFGNPEEREHLPLKDNIEQQQ
jgi:hypothetical protein